MAPSAPASEPKRAAAPPATPQVAPSRPIPAAASPSRPQATGAVPASPFSLQVLVGSAKGQRFRLSAALSGLGRSKGAILFSDDPYLSPLHATLIVRGGALFVKDEQSLSGVFVTIHATETIAPNTHFSVGNRLFRYAGALRPAPLTAAGRPIYGAPVPAGQALYAVEEILVGGRAGRTVLTAGPPLTIGQTHCDISINEEGLAHRHCELSISGSSAVLRDLSGGLGTLVRLDPGVERPIRPGDRIRVGQSVLLVEAA